MGVIKKLYSGQNVGASAGSSQTEADAVYPVTSAKAVIMADPVNRQKITVEDAIRDLYERTGAIIDWLNVEEGELGIDDPGGSENAGGSENNANDQPNG